MSADVYLYTGEVNPEDVRLRSGVLGAISVTLVGVAAVAAIGDGTIKVTFAISGVAATPAVGTVTFKATFRVTGVAASPAVGTLRFNVTYTLTGVSATPAIGIGTVTTAAGAAVLVNLVGVGANPQIGSGTVLTGSVAPPVTELVAGGGRWYGIQEDETVYLTGVAASPRVGSGTVAIADFKLYPFPKRKIEVAKPYTAPKRVPVQVVEKAPENVVVRMVGVQSVATVGTGTVKRVFDLLDEEIMALLEAA